MAAVVVDDTFKSLDKKQHYAALFVDLSKAFNTADHNICYVDSLLWLLIRDPPLYFSQG